MNRILDIGYPLWIGNNDEPFIIRDILGKGASSVTYLAECNQTEHVLKECNPLGLHMHRDDNGRLVPDTDLNKTKFDEYLARFADGANKQLAFRMTETLKNSTSNVQKIYHANSTTYIDMTYFKGCTYDKVENESLFDLLRRMRSIAKVVGGYHDMGYLHLDIKPQNIYAIPETPEMVMMFDFDSVVPEADVEKTVLFSYTDSWAAPEQKMAKYRKSICKATDLFAIGEMIFYRIMGRHSNADERFDFSTYAYDMDARIFKNVNPKVFKKLDELFHKIICCAAANRVQNAEELIALLDEIIPLANPKEPFLVSTLPAPKEFFIGRDTEIEEIHTRLQQNPVLFLHGIGGIGKSELAKQYAKKYVYEYDTVIFAPYVTDMVSLIANDNCIHIANFSRFIDEKAEEYYERKKDKIKELIEDNGERILLIVDNLDTTEDQNIKLLFGLGCHVLITSRVDMVAIFNRPQMEITALGKLEFARELFKEYYHFADEEADDVDAIINLVQGHTLAIELIAKQIDAEWSNIKTIRIKLEAGGMSSIGNEDIDNAKDDIATQDSAFGHIKALFDLSIFEKGDKDNELYVLANLSLVPFTGVDRRLFADWCDLENHGGKTCVNNLIKSGWIQRNRDLIALHPLVSEVARIHGSSIRFNAMLKNIIAFIDSDEYDYIPSLMRNGIAEILLEISTNICNLNIHSEEVAIFLSKSAMVYLKYGHLSSAISNLEKAKSVCLSLLGQNNRTTALVYSNLGHLYDEIGDFNKAEASCLIALDIQLAIHKDAHEDIVLAYNELSILYDHTEKYDKSEEVVLKSLQTCDMFNNKIQKCCAQAYLCAGRMYHGMGDFVNAELYYKKSYSVYEALFGSVHRNIALVLNDLAITYQYQSKIDEAEKCLKQSLKIDLQLYGEKSICVATAYQNLGSLYKDNQDKFQESEAYLQKALTLYISMYGEINRYVETVYNSLGLLYSNNKKFVLAKDYFLKSFELAQNVYGVNHPHTGVSAQNLAILFFKIKEKENAETWFLKSIDIYERTYVFSYKLIQAYNNIAIFYIGIGLYEKAIQYYEKSLKFSCKLDFHDEEILAKIKNNLGICYREQGDTARAELFFQDALNLRLSLFNDNHLDVAQTYAGLGRLYRTIGHYSLAAEYFQKALVIREKLLGMDHEDVQQTIRNLEECRTHL